jgi:hypothetical protein
LLFTLKNLLMISYVFKKHKFFLKTMKIVEFYLMVWGKLFELEPEPEFLTSWSRSRSWSWTKIDRLRNTAGYLSYTHFSRDNVPLKVGLLYNMVEQGATIAASKFLPGAALWGDPAALK